MVINNNLVSLLLRKNQATSGLKYGHLVIIPSYIGTFLSSKMTKQEKTNKQTNPPSLRHLLLKASPWEKTLPPPKPFGVNALSLLYTLSGSKP